MTTLLAVPSDDFFLGIGLLLVALFISERIWNKTEDVRANPPRPRGRSKKAVHAPSDPERFRKH